MGERRYKLEEIIVKLRQVEVLSVQGLKCWRSCPTSRIHAGGVLPVSQRVWRSESGSGEARLKYLEKDNAWSKRLLADPEFDQSILKEAASENW